MLASYVSNHVGGGGVIQGNLQDIVSCFSLHSKHHSVSLWCSLMLASYVSNHVGGGGGVIQGNL